MSYESTLSDMDYFDTKCSLQRLRRRRTDTHPKRVSRRLERAIRVCHDPAVNEFVVAALGPLPDGDFGRDPEAIAWLAAFDGMYSRAVAYVIRRMEERLLSFNHKLVNQEIYEDSRKREAMHCKGAR